MFKPAVESKKVAENVKTGGCKQKLLKNLNDIYFGEKNSAGAVE